jgi:WD40 repeat protein
VSIDRGGTIILSSAKAEELFRFTDTARTARSILLSPNRQFVLGYGIGETMTLYDSTTGKEAVTFRGHMLPVVDAAFTPDGRHVLSVGMDRTFRFWETASGKQVQEMPLPDIGTNVAVSPDGTYALTSAGAGDQGEVHLWRLPMPDKLAD